MYFIQASHYLFLTDCITRKEFAELKLMICKVYAFVSKESERRYPASAAELHETVVNEKFKHTVIPCKEPEHITALNNVFADIKLATHMVSDSQVYT